MSQPVVESTAPRRRAALFFPLAVFALLVALFFVRLYAGDASRIPSALIGKQVPTFVLPPLEGLQGVPGLTNEDLRQGHVSVVNVFASWCAPCHIEHPTLMVLARDEGLKAKGVRIVGLTYKDEPLNALKFLKEDGNPFAQIGVDQPGRVAIDFGVYGVPETFIVRGDGAIAYKFVGPLTAEAVQTTLIPEIEKAMQ
jgi:cytochrome c biogenesis protein CcmG/thiol:disulfide interchange protein DsbE